MARLCRHGDGIAAAALGSACAPPAPPAPPDGWHQRSWTRDGSDATSITVDADGRAIVVAPSTNWGGNSRSIFGPKGVPQTPDQLSCATVSDAGPMTQEGLALRISDGDGRHRVYHCHEEHLALNWVGSTTSISGIRISESRCRPLMSLSSIWPAQSATPTCLHGPGDCAPGSSTRISPSRCGPLVNPSLRGTILRYRFSPSQQIGCTQVDPAYT